MLCSCLLCVSPHVHREQRTSGHRNSSQKRTGPKSTSDIIIWVHFNGQSCISLLHKIKSGIIPEGISTGVWEKLLKGQQEGEE